MHKSLKNLYLCSMKSLLTSIYSFRAKELAQAIFARRMFIILAPIVVLWQLPNLAWGQNAQNTLLPEINPQDIEIRSEFKANFPGLRRQPILGFNPTPRVFQIDPNRMPFLESREAAVAGIDVTQLDRPALPERLVWETPNRPDFQTTMGLGWFISPEARAQYARSVGKGRVELGTQYRSSDGHLEDASGYRVWDTEVTYRVKPAENRSLAAKLAVNSDFNRMYRLSDGVQNLEQGILAKDYMGLQLDTEYQVQQSTFESWNYRLGLGSFSTNMNGQLAVFQDDASEQFISLSAEHRRPGKQVREYWKVSIGVDFRQHDTRLSNHQSYLFSGNTSYARLYNYAWALDATLGLALANDGIASGVYLTPDIQLAYNHNDVLGGMARFFGRVEQPYLSQWQDLNRFLFPLVSLRNHYVLGIQTEAYWNMTKQSRLYSGILYNHWNRYGFMVQRLWQAGDADNTTGQDQSLFYTLNYAQANRFTFYVGARASLLSDVLSGDIQLNFSNPKLSSGAEIPYEESFNTEANLVFTPTAKLKSSLSALLVGSRINNQGNDLNGFILLNARAEYSINQRFGVYLKLNNLLSQNYEWWQGYEEPPVHFFGGINYRL